MPALLVVPTSALDRLTTRLYLEETARERLSGPLTVLIYRFRLTCSFGWCGYFRLTVHRQAGYSGIEITNPVGHGLDDSVRESGVFLNSAKEGLLVDGQHPNFP